LAADAGRRRLRRVLVLSGIQLRAENGRRQLAATDVEVSLRTRLECSVDGELVERDDFVDISSRAVASSRVDAEVGVSRLDGDCELASRRDCVRTSLP
jgi:hypothetical protein